MLQIYSFFLNENTRIHFFDETGRTKKSGRTCVHPLGNDIVTKDSCYVGESDYFTITFFTAPLVFTMLIPRWRPLT